VEPLKSTNLAEVASQWDADFVDLEQEQLFDLILAANYLDIRVKKQKKNTAVAANE
jgi:S-phase kinase-associated protein 1